MEKSFTKETIQECIESLTKCYPHLAKGLMLRRGVLDKIVENYDKLAFPNHPNWSYCLPIIPNYTTKEGEVVDLGIFLDAKYFESLSNPRHHLSANFVTSNEAPDYGSGDIALTSEESKAVLIQLHNWEIVSDDYIMGRLCDHNGFLNKFLKSHLTSWDLQYWLEEKIKSE